MSLFNLSFFPRFLLIVLGIFSVLSLSACGYRPLYGAASANPATEANLAAIEIAPLYERTGQILHTELGRRLYPRGGQAGITTHILRITTTQSTTNLAVAKNTAATRANYRLNASYQLIRKSDQRPVLSNSIFSTISYNILSSDYANTVAAKNARERAAMDISEQLAQRMAIYFNAQENSTAK